MVRWVTITQLVQRISILRLSFRRLELDVDKAKFYMKAAGLTELNVDLSASDAAFTGAVDACTSLPRFC